MIYVRECAVINFCIFFNGNLVSIAINTLWGHLKPNITLQITLFYFNNVANLIMYGNKLRLRFGLV